MRQAAAHAACDGGGIVMVRVRGRVKVKVRSRIAIMDSPKYSNLNLSPLRFQPTSDPFRTPQVHGAFCVQLRHFRLSMLKREAKDTDAVLSVVVGAVELVQHLAYVSVDADGHFIPVSEPRALVSHLSSGGDSNGSNLSDHGSTEHPSSVSATNVPSGSSSGGLASLGGVFGARGGGFGGAFANVVGEAIAQREAADGRQTYMVRNA